MSHNSPTPPPALLAGRWFDGTSSQARRVLVGLHSSPTGPSLSLHPLAGATPDTAPALTLAHRDVGWPEAWNGRGEQRRVVVDLRQHGSLEIDNTAQWHAALQAAGAQGSLAQRMQTRLPMLLGIVAVAAVGLTLFYRYGTPWLATQLTRYVPLSAETAVASNAMRQLDDGLLKPSKLPPERQAALRQRFDQMVQTLPPALQRYPGYQPTYRLDFRSGMGANAFALPGGQIVMTDAIVQESDKAGLGDNALLGVLSHEIGHVVHRHTSRMVVEQGVLNLGLSLALGDVSAIVATGSTVLTGKAYSRNHEREADCFAIAVLRQQQIPATPMADLLMRISEASVTKEPEPSASDKAPPPKKDEPHAIWSMLSSHPDTLIRAQELRAGHAEHCAR